MGIRLIRKSSWERTEKANRKALRPRSLQGALREAKAALGRAKRFHAEGPGAVMGRDGPWGDVNEALLLDLCFHVFALCSS